MGWSSALAAQARATFASFTLLPSDIARPRLQVMGSALETDDHLRKVHNMCLRSKGGLFQQLGNER
jgi:hypothetical protein